MSDLLTPTYPNLPRGQLGQIGGVSLGSVTYPQTANLPRGKLG